MVQINLIGESRKVEDVAVLASWRKLWKADKQAISTYAEYQWTLLEAGCLDEVHWSCMFQDRIVRRRYDKRLRDVLHRMALPCLECGKLTLRPKWARKVFCSRSCSDEFSRLNLMPTYEQRERRPVVRIGQRSLKALRSNTWRGERRLTTSTVMTSSARTPANVKGQAWKGHRVRARAQY